MNNIGFGIFCFGEDYYFKGTVEKINNIVDNGFQCYILTDNIEFFNKRYAPMYVHVIEYTREFKSYSDKILLSKYILKNHDICVLIDADTHITNYSFIHILKKYEFKEGVTYIDTLLNHKTKKQFIHEFDMNGKDWKHYNSYTSILYPNFIQLELMWEYFLVINKNGFNDKDFYRHYERLQVAKEYGDLLENKGVNGAGEGISIQVSSILSDTPIQRDATLYELIKNQMVSISKRHTPRHLWPKWMI